MSELFLRKRGSKWEYSFEGAKIEGKRHRISKGGFRTKGDASRAGTKALAEYNQTGQFISPSEVSCADFFREWLEQGKINWKHITYIRYKQDIELYIIPEIGSYHLNRVTPARLQKLLNDKALSLSLSSVKSIKQRLNAAFRYAEENNYLSNNPTRFLRTPAPRAAAERGTEKQISGVISPEEWNRIMQIFPPTSAYHLPLMIAYHTGMRLGEVCGLTWDCVDFKTKTININKQLYNIKNCAHVFTNPKYDSSRIIKMGSSLISVLKQARLEQKKNIMRYGGYYHQYHEGPRRELLDGKGPIAVDLVCVWEDGRAIRYANYTKFSKKIKEAGIAFHFHALRKTHTTRLLESGAPIKDVQMRLGHKSVNVTLQIYAEVTETMQNKTQAILDSII